MKTWRVGSVCYFLGSYFANLARSGLPMFDNQVVCLDRSPKWGTTSGAFTKDFVIKIRSNLVC